MHECVDEKDYNDGTQNDPPIGNLNARYRCFPAKPFHDLPLPKLQAVACQDLTSVMATTGLVPDTNQNSLVWVPAMTRFLIVLGLAILVVGLLWPYLARIGLGRLPGDLVIQRDNVTLYVPLMTCLLLSLLFSLILWAVNR